MVQALLNWSSLMLDTRCKDYKIAYQYLLLAWSFEQILAVWKSSVQKMLLKTLKIEKWILIRFLNNLKQLWIFASCPTAHKVQSASQRAPPAGNAKVP